MASLLSKRVRSSVSLSMLLKHASTYRYEPLCHSAALAPRNTRYSPKGKQRYVWVVVWLC